MYLINSSNSLLMVGVFGLELRILCITFRLTISRLGCILFNFDTDFSNLVQWFLEVVIVIFNDLLMNLHLTVVVVDISLEVMEKTWTWSLGGLNIFICILLFLFDHESIVYSFIIIPNVIDVALDFVDGRTRSQTNLNWI